MLHRVGLQHDTGTKRLWADRFPIAEAALRSWTPWDQAIAPGLPAGSSSCMNLKLASLLERWAHPD